MKVREETAPYASADSWFLYILRCGDGSLYTGVTTDIDRRLKLHQEGKASRYTRTHQPVALVYREACGSRSQALVRECAVKSLSREGKERLMAGGQVRSPRRKIPAGPTPRKDSLHHS
jgi:putative endonuclease